MNWITHFFASIVLGVGSLFGGHGHVTSTTTPLVPPAVPVVSQPAPTTPPSAPAVSQPVVTGVSLSSITPTSGKVGSTVTIYGKGFLATNTVLFGGGPVNNVYSVNGGSKLSFVVPSSVGADCKANQACPMYARLITNGTYTVAVRNVNGTSGTLSFIVTGGGVVIPPPNTDPIPVPAAVPTPQAQVQPSITFSVSATPASTIGIVGSTFSIATPSSGGSAGLQKTTSFSGSFTVSSGNNAIYISNNAATAFVVSTNIAGVSAAVGGFAPANGSQSNDGSTFFTISGGTTRTFTFTGTLTNTTGGSVSAAAGITKIYLATDSTNLLQIPIDYSLQGLNSDFHIQVLLGVN